MPLSKDDNPKSARKKADAPDTPSAIALDEVGEPKEKASDEERLVHSEKYAEAKRKARWG